MSLLKTIARVGLHHCGILPAIRWNSRAQFSILTYHRFSPALYPGGRETMERQCAYLKRAYRVVPLAEIGESLRSGKPLPRRALAVTIDDGYRDFLLDAVPVFQSFRIPSTMFLMTDFIDGKEWPWWNKVAYAAEHSPAKTVRVSMSGEAGRDFHLRTAAQREHAAEEICAQVTRLPNRSRLAFIRTLPEVFQVGLPDNAPPGMEPLSWDEVRSLTGKGVEFGAHTKTHPVLPSVEDEDEIFEEIAGSKSRIDEELGRPTLHFCYPNGDFNDTVVRAVDRCGFETAVTTVPGFNATGEDRYRLKRFSVELNLPDPYFREQVAGLHG